MRVLAELSHSQIKNRPLRKSPVWTASKTGRGGRLAPPRKRQMDRITGMARNNPALTIYGDSAVSGTFRHFSWQANGLSLTP